ncbi:MAG: thiamine diphosphokinase [Alphaproteobacteria bacterium]|nr:thiamine diphosphokinase [Alphaproteobacteria bacterium]
MKKIEEFKCIICLNGSIPDYNFFARVKELKIPVIAVDGAANLLLNIDIIPDFIVGDMDSFKGSKHIPQDRVIVTEDQNYTDFEKTIKFVKEASFGSALVLGMNGGEIDHIINNVNTFVRYSRELSMWFYDIPSKGHSKLGAMSVNGTLDFNLEEGAMVSLFSYDQGKLKTEGLVWEINSKAFPVMEKSAARNKAQNNKVKVMTTQDKVLTIYDGKIS